MGVKMPTSLYQLAGGSAVDASYHFGCVALTRPFFHHKGIQRCWRIGKVRILLCFTKNDSAFGRLKEVTFQHLWHNWIYDDHRIRGYISQNSETDTQSDRIGKCAHTHTISHACFLWNLHSALKITYNDSDKNNDDNNNNSNNNDNNINNNNNVFRFASVSHRHICILRHCGIDHIVTAHEAKLRFTLNTKSVFRLAIFV